MDIDDLLAEVSVDSTSQETRDLQELTRCWVAERVAPEVLPWPAELMDRILGRIERQVSLIVRGRGGRKELVVFFDTNDASLVD